MNSAMYRVAGSTQDVTECGLCGRTDLKQTVIMVPLDADGNAVADPTYMGVDCAAKAAGWTQRDVKAQARTADDEARKIAEREAARQREAEFKVWNAWVEAQSGIIGELNRGIQALGGFAKARAAYRAAL